MRRKLLFILLVLTATFTWAGETMLYGLQQVTSSSKLKSGERYVLVQNGRAILHKESNDGLATQEINVNQAISISDDCVWTLDGTGGFFNLTCTINGIEGSLRNNASKTSDSKTSSHNLCFGVISFYPTIWQFIFSNGVAQIKNVTSNSVNQNRYLTIVGDVCYAEKSGNTGILVYQLVPTDYTRTEISSGQIGTICLPFATKAYSGATFYTLTCKETDGAGDPAKVYYEEVNGQLEAGKPYIYVPDNNATTLSFTAAEGTQATTPNNYNGLIGTFTQIDPAEQNVLTANYVIQGNHIRKCGSNCGLRAYRAYIQMNEVPNIGEVSTPSRRMLVIGQTTAPEYMDPNQGVWTSLAEKAAKKQVQRVLCNGKVILVRDGVNYDVLGRKCYE